MTTDDRPLAPGQPEEPVPTWEHTRAALLLVGLPENRMADWERLYESVAAARTARLSWNKYGAFIGARRRELAEASVVDLRKIQNMREVTNLGATQRVLADIRAERARQQQAEGYALEHDDDHDITDWLILIDQYAEMARNGPELPDTRRRLVQVAALTLAAIEAVDRSVEYDLHAAFVPPADGDAPRSEFDPGMLAVADQP